MTSQYPAPSAITRNRRRTTVMTELMVTDILVVGEGAAGQTAALTASEEGCDVIVLGDGRPPSTAIPARRSHSDIKASDVCLKSSDVCLLARISDKPIGANTLRSCLVLCLSMILCASASAATVNHSRTHHHVTASHSQGVTSGFAVPSWAYAAPRPPVGGGGFGRGGHMGGFGGGAHVGGIDVGHIGQFGGDVNIDGVSVGHVGEIGGGVRVGGLAVGGMGRFGASYIGDHGVHHYTMLRFGRQWSGYSLYPYDPDCNDFLFRHPDYQWQPSCS
jgi:FAD binding domain